MGGVGVSKACSSCSSRVQRKLNKLDGVDASVNFSTETAAVDFDASTTTPQMLIDEGVAVEPRPDALLYAQDKLEQFYIPEEQSIYLLSHDDAKKLKD